MADPQGEDRSTAAAPCVLAIDDEQENLDLIVRSLRRDFRMLSALTGEQGLDVLGREEDVAVILADYRLPGMNGIEVLAQASHRAPAARRIIITAHADIDVVVDAINRGHVHHFVKKPWEPTELLAVVHGVLDFSRLETENNRLVAELRAANDTLTGQRRLLESSLDERGRELLSRTRELEAANRELAVLAYRDGLTGLYNHRTLQERLREELARARRYRKPLGLVFGDLDGFKGYNDTLGHPRGDEALRLLAGVLSGGIPVPNAARPRESDIVARYGGEEFVLLLPETSVEGARVKAERLREAVAATRFPDAERTPAGALTMSFGVAGFPDDARSADDLIAAADRACYLAKRRGRNQVCSAAEAAAVIERDRASQDSPGPAAPTVPERPLGRTRDGRGARPLPTLAESTEAISGALVERGALGCLYVDLSGLRRIELELGSTTLAGVLAEAQALLRDPRRIRLHVGDILCRLEGGEAFAIFVGERTGARGATQGGEDDALDALATRLQACLDQTLGGRMEDLLHERPRIAIGRARVLHSSLVRTERLVAQLVEEARESAGFERRLRQARDKRAVQDLILATERKAGGSGIQTVFQPIVHLPSAAIFGYEALARGPQDSPLAMPHALFSIAEDVGLLFETDRACFRAALRHAAGAPPTHRLFLNLLPLSFYDETFLERDVDRMVSAVGLTPANVVFEITERLAIENFGSFRRALARATARGFGVAIDDVGTRHANLEAVIALRPNFLKLSEVIVRGIAHSAAKREMIRSLAGFAETIDAVLVAEGIEGEADLAALVEAGVTYGQGFYLARPAPAEPTWVELEPAVVRAVRDIAERHTASRAAGKAAGERALHEAGAAGDTHDRRSSRRTRRQASPRGEPG